VKKHHEIVWVFGASGNSTIDQGLLRETWWVL